MIASAQRPYLPTDRTVLREAILATGVAAAVATALVYVAPPGIDLAAHMYQRTLFIQHGLTFWNNFWYAGRYSFVTYSLLYYPLAALLGITLLAVSTVAAAALAFSVVVWRQWGSAACWSSRVFAVTWAGTVLMAMFPFALGAAFALLAIWAAQGRHMRRLAVLSLLSLAASPVAFVLLLVVLVAVGIARRAERWLLAEVSAMLVALCSVEVVLWRLFPSAGSYPFVTGEFIAALGFCVAGTVLTWRDPRTSILRYLFPIYACACALAYVTPSALGENIDRLRYLAIPLTLLVLSVRNWRPRLLSALALVLAVTWNLSPLATSFANAQSDPAASASYWTPAIRYLKAHLSANYRVEAVDTIGHWAAVYLPDAGIPLARGWYRQDDFPQNAVLYGRLGARAYVSWIHRLGVGYIVLTTAPPDYSARAEEKLITSGQLPLRLVLGTQHLRVYAVRSPQPLITGPGRPRITNLADSSLSLAVTRPGTYRIAVNASPYWHTSAGCLSGSSDRMILLRTPIAGQIHLDFAFSATAAVRAIADGNSAGSCRKPPQQGG
jgi:hypothetical protein